MARKSEAEIARKIEGLHTAKGIARKLGIAKRTALNYISKLRKAGLVETLHGRVHLYRLRQLQPPEKGLNFFEELNKYSKVKLTGTPQYIHQKNISVEELLARAVQTRDFRVVLASLSLFRKIKNWKLLNKLARKFKMQRRLGALYELARAVTRVRRIDGRTYKSLLKGRDQNKFIIPNLRSGEFQSMEKKWKVFIPFSKKDLESYND